MIIFKFKILLLGPPMVGKTSLMYRYVNNEFSEQYIASLGAQFLTKEINVASGTNHSEKIKLIIWDIMGQSNPAFEDLRTTFYRGADGAILLFDLTRKDSLDKLSEWHAQVKKIIDKELPVLLIGNKLDLINDSEASNIRENAQKLANSIDSTYIETSAKTGANVDNAFHKLAFNLVERAGHDITGHEIDSEATLKANQLDFVVKSRIKDYISSKGLWSSKNIFNSLIINERIREILDNAMMRATKNGRKTVKERDL